ncbi:MAG: ABC transporter substrate-binding protein [Conexibacteraceae bacterium]|nr:ABC transporter substrate-binding protein [Conexibacteraceae bacterium]
MSTPERGALTDQDAAPSVLTRREALRGAVVGGAMLAGASLLTPASASASVAKSKIKSGGALRVGATGGGAQDSIDAHFATSDPDIARLNQLYEPLLVRDPQFNLKYLVAESMTPAHTPDVWTVKLRKGVTFHNGKPVTADDVLFSIARIINPKKPGTGAASIGYIDLKKSKKIDTHTVRIALQYPNIGFPDDIGQYFNGIVPVGYNPKHPIGTGPFEFKSFSPGVQSVFNRYPHYWQGPALVDSVTILDFADDTSKVNALLGGQVDCITNLPAAQISQIKGTSGMAALISQCGAWQPFTMRVDQAPFNDVRVRQAFRLIVDRRQMVEQALLGQGHEANDLYARYDPAYDSALPQRQQDLEQAKFLLKKAGHANLKVNLTTADIYQGIVEAAQVFAQQAKGAGVTVNLQKVDPTTFYGPNYLKWPFAQDFWFTRNYLPQVEQGSLPNSPFNETHWANPQFQKLIKEAQATVDTSKRTELLHAAQKLEYESGGYIVWSFSNQIDAYSTKVSGFTPARSGEPLTNYGFYRVGFVG